MAWMQNLERLSYQSSRAAKPSRANRTAIKRKNWKKLRSKSLHQKANRKL